MVPVLVGAAGLALWALCTPQKSNMEAYGVGQISTATPAGIGPGFLAAVKNLGNTAAKFPSLMHRLGPIFQQVDVTRGEAGEPGFLRGFAIPIGDAQSGFDLELLQALAVVVGRRHGLLPSWGRIMLPSGEIRVVGFTTTPGIFWDGADGGFPLPGDAKKIVQRIGGRRPGFDPAHSLRTAAVAAKGVRLPKVKMPRLGKRR